MFTISELLISTFDLNWLNIESKDRRGSVLFDELENEISKEVN